MEEKITAWVARNKSGILFMYTRKPIKGKSCETWYFEAGELHGTRIEMDAKKFPQVKWKDKEPTKVELTIKICE